MESTPDRRPYRSNLCRGEQGQLRTSRRRPATVHRRPRPVGLTSVAVVLLTAALVTPTLAAASHGTVISPKSVAQIVRTDYQINNVANANLSYALQEAHEEGTALAIDNTTFRADKLSGLATIDGAHYYPFYGTVVSSSVSKQSSYPARFAVVTKQSSGPGTPTAQRMCPGTGDALTFSKDSPKSDWRVSIEPYLPRLNAVPKFATTRDGFAAPLSVSLKHYVHTLPALYVKALNAQAVNGRATALLPASYFLHATCSELDLVNPQQESQVIRGLKLHFSASVLAPSDLAAFATKGGGALAMFTFREQISEVPTVANDYVIWSHGATPWWSLLPTGHYSKVSWTIDQGFAVVVPPTGVKTGPRVVGSTAGVVTVVGTPVG